MITMIFLVLSFGWRGSPGEWMVWAWAALLHHAHFRPEQPWRDGPERFMAWALMDDTILVEPQLGARPWLSGQAFEEGVKLMMGPEAINEDKKAEEGEFSTKCKAWGIMLDTVEDTAAIPRSRLDKCRKLLAEPALASGNKDISLLDLQRVRGVGTAMAIVVPNLNIELKAVDPFLGPTRGRFAAPSVGEGQVEAAWQDLWEALDAFRLLLSREDQWETSSSRAWGVS